MYIQVMPYIKKNEAENIKKQIYALHKNNGDWRLLAHSLGVKQSTAYQWIKNEDKPVKQRGGRRNFKIKDEHLIFMEQCIEINPKITLLQMKEQLHKEHNIDVTTECVRKHLDGLLYTLKDIRRESEKANSDDNKIKRSAYVKKLLEYQAESVPIIYMDETNFNLYISRTKGRSKKGSRCTNISAGSKGSNIHVIGCIGNMGLVHNEIRRGSFRKPEAADFIRVCLRKAQVIYQSPVIMVTDNAPCHASLDEIFQEEEFKHHRLLRLGPYSPMLNPIEYTWSSLKAGVKRNLEIEMPNILANEGRSDLTQTEFRLQQLENIIRKNIPQITVSNCARNIAHIQRFIPSVINMEDVTF